MNKTFLLDALALIFRAYWALMKNPRITSTGFNTSTIFGFVNTLEEILNKEKPSHIAVVFDPSGPNFRHEMYPDYKAHREATPEEIKKSIPYIKEILNAYRIPAIECSGFEADDVIGTIAKKFAAKDNQIFMMTPDKDYAQLIEENIFMYKPTRAGNPAEVIGVNEITKKYYIQNPLQVIDILALWGDAADNVPGIQGIGEKTATRLISTYGSIDNIFNNINNIPEKQKEAIIQNKEQLYLAQKLVTIDINVPINIELKELKLKTPDFNEINRIFDNLEFKTLKARVLENKIQFTESKPAERQIKKTIPTQQLSLFEDFGYIETANNNDVIIDNNISQFSNTPGSVSYTLIESIPEIENLINKLKTENEICIDTETTDLNTLNAQLAGLAISFKESEAYYINMPVNFDETKSILERFNVIFNDNSKLIIGQNLKYDLSVLMNYGIGMKAKLFDTMLAHYLIEPEQKHNLDALAMKYLNYKMIPITELIGEKGKNQKKITDIDPKIVSNYSCEDADITLRLKNIFIQKLKENNLDELFYKIEIPLINVLISMERNGVKLDIENLNSYKKELETDLQHTENKIYELATERFNISSPRQLGIILFEKLKIINNPKKTKTKQYSTGEEELQKLTGKHDIINEILNYRSITKLLNTYIEALPQLVNPKTGKIHTSFNQTITATGRLSSTNPNIQNIPIREERGREIRKSFIASDKEHIFFSADYSQIELRIMAHLSQDKNMLEAFNKYSLDIHTATAAKIFKVEEKVVTREMRNRAKTANFGIIYGISAFGLAERLQISRTDAKTLIDNYFETFPDVKAFIDTSISKAREKGYVDTIFGRRRYLPDINSSNNIVRSFSERNAINAPIQGSSADIIKLAMVNIYKSFEQKNLKSKMILQVHDELNFDVLISEKDVVKEIVLHEMQNVIKLSVPLDVDAKFGDNWLEAH